MNRPILRLLGGFTLELESRVPVVIPTRRAQALFAYLACSPLDSHSRDQLALTFWGELPQACTRHSLRQTLYVLRNALAPSGLSILGGDSTSVSIDRSGFDVDALELERLTAIGSLEALQRACTLYRGPFLAGIGAGDLAFEEWLLQERERLTGLAVRAHAKLADLQRAAGLTENAIRTAENALLIDPTEELVHRMLMRLYLSTGRPGAARRQYDKCARTLRREFGVDPDAETKNLLREVSSARPTASLHSDRGSRSPSRARR